MPLNRKNFIRQSACILAGASILPGQFFQTTEKIFTVNGAIDPGSMGFTLTHEHTMVDFIGADKINPARYNAAEVFQTALPKLMSAKERGCQTLVECTPAWLGRDAGLLQRLSLASGLNILTNTGYYAAAAEKYLPAHAYKESANQTATRWIREWEQGIDNTGIKPGFIKTGVDKYPLTAVQRKIVEAAAITHLATGLTIGIHTGDGTAALEELDILESNGVGAHAWIWIHAQNEKKREVHFRIAKAGGWVSFDGINLSTMDECIAFLNDMKKENLLGQILLSQDSGWYHVGEPHGGRYNDYNTIADHLLPALKAKGFTAGEISKIFISNPARAFTVSIRKKS